MIDLPNPRDQVGPAQIQQLMRDIEWLKDLARSHQIVSSPTVRAVIQSHGTTLEAAAPAPVTPASAAMEQFAVKSIHKDILICNRLTRKFDSITGAITYELDSEDVQVLKPFTLQATMWNSSDRISANPALSASVNGEQYIYSAGSGTSIDVTQRPWVTREVRKTLFATDAPSSAYTVSFDQTVDPPWLAGGPTILAGLQAQTVSIIFAEKLENPLLQRPSVLVNGVPVTEAVDCSYIDANVDGRRWEDNRQAVRICIENADGSTTSKFVQMRTSRNYDVVFIP